jgi:hypothetical protein
METTVIHNVPYYIDPATNALYTYNEAKLHIGSYEPTTHNVFYNESILLDPRLLVELTNARALAGPAARSSAAGSANKK